MEKIKENIKEIIALLVLLLVIGGVFYGKYIYNKNRKEKLREYSAQLTSQSAEEINSTKSTLWSKIKGGVGNFVHVDNNSENSTKTASNKNSNTNTLIHFDVSSEYNSFIFDDRLLMFDGEQDGSNVINTLDIMLKDATDDYYSNPKITVRNIGGIEGTFEDNAEYISNLNNIKNIINENGKYNISFGYNKTKTTANEVIIEGK